VIEGFSIEPCVLSAAECDRLIDALRDLKGSRAGVRHLMWHPSVARIASDPRLVRLAGGAIPFRATLFEKSGEKNWLIAWHQDTALPLESRCESAEWGPWSEKGGIVYAHAPEWALRRVIALRVHLDASTSENGPLRVIPGSHSRLLSDAEVARIAAESVAIECPVPRGGVLVMRPLLVHASSKARVDRPRRVLHIEYAESLDLAAGVRLRVV
jgi:hypothetical protein